MEIKDILGDQYKEGMTAEEIIEALKGMDPPEYGPNTTAYNKLKSQFDKLASELAAAKKTAREVEQAKQKVEDDKQSKEEALQRQINTLKQAMMKSRTSEMFAKAGFEKNELIDNLIESGTFADESAMETFTQNYIKTLTDLKTSTEESVKQSLLNATPRPPAGDEPKPEDMSLTERMKLKGTDRNAYNALFGGNK